MYDVSMMLELCAVVHVLHRLLRVSRHVLYPSMYDSCRFVLVLCEKHEIQLTS